MVSSAIYIYISRLTAVSREAKEEVPCDRRATHTSILQEQASLNYKMS